MAIYKLNSSRKPGVTIGTLSAEPDKLYFDSDTQTMFMGNEARTPISWNTSGSGGGSSGSAWLTYSVVMPDVLTYTVLGTTHTYTKIESVIILNLTGENVHVVQTINPTTHDVTINSNISLLGHTIVIVGY